MQQPNKIEKNGNDDGRDGEKKKKKIDYMDLSKDIYI